DYADPRPASRTAVDHQLAVMGLDQALADRQPEAGAAVEACRASVGLAERLQGPLQLLGAHADAVVLDFEGEPAGRVERGADIDPAAVMREFDGVRQQVEHDLLDRPLVA